MERKTSPTLRRKTGLELLKSTPKPSQIHVGLILRLLATLGASWGRLGVVLGASWDVLERLGRIFFRLGCVFGWTFIAFLIDAGSMFEPFVVESALWGLPRVSERFPRCASTASRE